MDASLQIVAMKLADRAAERRKSLSDDVVAEALDEIIDAIAATVAESKGHGDPVASHIEAHARDFETRQAPGDSRLAANSASIYDNS